MPSDCVADVMVQLATVAEALNADKTEAIGIGIENSHQQAVIAEPVTDSRHWDHDQSSDVVRDLGVLFDSVLTKKKHTGKVAAACFFHIRRFRQIRSRVGKDVTIRLVSALMTPRLDYCNSVLTALPQSTVESLQRVQNAAARLVFGIRHRDHVSPYLIQLHWLPFKSRVHNDAYTPFTTKDLHHISQRLYRLRR